MSKNCWSIKPKNSQQKDAIDCLLDPNIDLVVLEGIAGSGKTLLALAAGLQQTVDDHKYSQIIFTRAPVGIGSDMGFLPGTEQEKLGPWCGALEDNLEVLLHKRTTTSVAYEGTKLVIKRYLNIKAMQFMRGRSFYSTWLIIDEVQNLDPAELKVLITRAGEDTKVICLGDVQQVDNKKLTTENNALAKLINSIGACEFIKAVYLPVGERSRLANWGGKYL